MPERNLNKVHRAIQALEANGLDWRIAAYFAPALALVAYYAGGETGLLFMSLSIPVIAGAISVALAARKTRDAPTELLGFNAFETLSKEQLSLCRSEGRKSAVFFVEIDDFEEIVDRYGQSAADAVLAQTVSRIRAALREKDLLGALGGTGVAICLAPTSSVDLETCLQLAGRISHAVEEPFSVDGTSVYASASVGFCQLGREAAAPSDPSDAEPVLTCARVALDAALAIAPSAIRAYSRDMKAKPPRALRSNQTILDALENGDILPWFQPQICTDTGQITGFECLARWIDPELGPISPAEFLGQLDAANKMGRLLEVILFHAFSAIKAWDQAGCHIQHVGINFSSSELSDPNLVDQVTWELDRFELQPERLAVEILETVVAQGPDDIITRNIRGLSDLGCQIDLDDFGTGHASLTSIRRFGVGRIKIDRSFVMKSDRDPEQQRMIRAILTMAERLELETLAEGIETVGEHAFLAQLGCSHVQGFGIGRPMPFEQTLDWIKEHNRKLQAPPKIGRSAG